MTKPAYLFDLDGTLADTLADIAASVNHVRTAHHLPALTTVQVRGFVGDGALKLLERALAEVGAFETIRDTAWQIYREHHLAQCTVHVQPYPGVVRWLERWHAERRPLGVVTNKSSAFVLRILEHLDLARFFPVVICGDTLPFKKPDPRPLRVALERLGAAHGQAMMVGDGLQDLRAGKAAGLRTAAVLFGFRDEALLRAEGADEYWRRFGESA
jgi:phosphoglycolate phosphatase